MKQTRQPFWQAVLTKEEDIYYIRHCTRQLTILAKVSPLEQSRFIAAVTEIAENALTHAHGAEVIFALLEKDNKRFLELCFADKGSGIRALNTMKLDKDSLIFIGSGISSARDLVDHFYINSSQDGTEIKLQKLVQINLNLPLDKIISEWVSTLKTISRPTALDKIHFQDEQIILALAEIKEMREVLTHEQLLLEDRTKELEEAHKFKSNLVAHMSHEMRTLLNAILGTSNLLIRTTLSNEQKSFIFALQKASQSLLAVVNDALEFSKLEANKLVLSNIFFDLSLIVNNTISFVQLQSWGKRIDVRLFYGPSLPAIVRGDPHRLEQILSNLLVNAVKFSPDNSEIVLIVYNNKVSSQSTEVKFLVMDAGEGISEHDQSRIFESFTQLDDTNSQSYKGSGMGLNIARNLATLMQGRLHMLSKKRVGSAFWLEAPFEHTESKPSLFSDNLRQLEVIFTGKSSPYWELVLGALGIEYRRTLDQGETKDSGGGKKLIRINSKLASIAKPSQIFDILMELANLPYRFSELNFPSSTLSALPQHPKFASFPDTTALLIDDDAINRLINSAQLEEFGIKVSVSCNAEEALSEISKKRYSLIFMDLQMPDTDGCELTQMIRKKEESQGCHVPIIALTANAMDGAREQCLSSGMDDYLTKPVDIALLYRTCEKWLNKPTEELVDKTSFKKYTPEQQQQLVQMFQADSAELLDKMDAKFQIQDAKTIGALAHTLKGASRVIYANCVATTCSNIENWIGENKWQLAQQEFANLKTQLRATIDLLQKLA